MIAQTEAQIAAILGWFIQEAMRAGGISLTHIAGAGGVSQWMVLTAPVVDLRHFSTIETAPSVTSASDHAARHGVDIKTMEALFLSALKGISYVPNLEHSRLAELIDLGRFAQSADNPLMARGLALQRALRHAIATLRHGSEEEKQAARYIQAHFMEHKTAREVSAALSVSESTVLRRSKAWIKLASTRLLTLESDPVTGF